MQISRRDLMKAGVAMSAAPQVAHAANDRIQVGVIGTGARSHELMQALLQLPSAHITAVVDAYTGRVERAVSRTKAKVHKDYKAVLADPSIDAVVIATPDHWHKTMVIEAVRAGKDVYCEKPLTFRAEEGVEIQRAVKESGRILQVGSQGVSSLVQQKAKEIIQSGKLGQITCIRAAYNRNSAGGAWIYPIPPDASPSTVNWDMFLGSAPKQPFNLERFFRWRCYQDYSGGISTDLFVHLCTTIHYLMNAKVPSKVVAMGQLYRWKGSRDVPDTINAVVEYPEGFAVNLSSTFNNEHSSEGSFQILGTEGTLTIGDAVSYFPEDVHEDNAWIVASWPEALERAYYQDAKIRESEMPGTRQPRIKEGMLQYRQEGVESTVAHMGHWLESIRSRQPYWEDAAAGHHAAAVAHMVNRSARTQRMVEWDFNADSIKT